jgi:hypothetical protein
MPSNTTYQTADIAKEEMISLLLEFHFGGAVVASLVLKLMFQLVTNFPFFSTSAKYPPDDSA